MADFPVTVETRGVPLVPSGGPQDLDAARENGRRRLLKTAKDECTRFGPATPTRIVDRALMLGGTPDCYNSQYLYRHGQKVESLRAELMKLLEQGEKEGWL